jgi:hypothetical protein
VSLTSHKSIGSLSPYKLNNSGDPYNQIINFSIRVKWVFPGLG